MTRPAIEEQGERRQREQRARAVETFPFERVRVPGERAFAAWEKLRKVGRGAPVVVGDDETFAILAERLASAIPLRLEDILAVAGKLRHPDALEERKQQAARARAELAPLFQPEDPDSWAREPEPPPLGAWPQEPPDYPGVPIVHDLRTAQPFPTGSIVLIPTDDWTTIPAYLRWGGWNACANPEYHVAALRSWRERFGAELVGLSHDVMILRVARPPRRPPAALDLAREHHLYCRHVVEAVGTLSALAAALAQNDWWYFWWD
jgi:hypothetical protein